ncbi:hypothetical protein CEXT_599861 [Caerostris extrusa]|uniref:Uncharacterized protein n=1 Tax=Caerostris extrusa TaxID=172846 RepID=A0AAV4Y827_CAEEX|nr:hypothetical protein CEXT_599861 [Caerostris extrusa]
MGRLRGVERGGGICECRPEILEIAFGLPRIKQPPVPVMDKESGRWIYFRTRCTAIRSLNVVVAELLLITLSLYFFYKAGMHWEVSFSLCLSVRFINLVSSRESPPHWY